jgi:hypothetical protein
MNRCRSVSPAGSMSVDNIFLMIVMRSGLGGRLSDTSSDTTQA